MAIRVFGWENQRAPHAARIPTPPTGRLDPEVRELVAGRAFPARYRTALRRRRPTPKPNGIGWSAPAAPSSMTPTAAHKHGTGRREPGHHTDSREMGPRTI